MIQHLERRNRTSVQSPFCYASGLARYLQVETAQQTKDMYKYKAMPSFRKAALMSESCGPELAHVKDPLALPMRSCVAKPAGLDNQVAYKAERH
jgi:hypothetical protein